MDQFIGILLGILIIILVVAMAFYATTGIILFKLNTIMYGKGTPMAWIPFCNMYLLGKLTVNKWMGWLLVILGLISTSFQIDIMGNNVIRGTFLPPGIVLIISTGYSIIVLILFIYAIIKYLRLR